MTAKHILLVDDHAMFRSGLAMVIELGLTDATVWQVASVAHAMELACPVPHAVLLDIRLGNESGLEGIELVHKRWPQVPVLMLSAFDEKTTIHHAMTRGAIGFVSKVETADMIVKTVQSIVDGSYQYGWVQPVLDDDPRRRLTPRQREVLQFMHQGMSNKLIARQLDLSNNTVRRHVQDILDALKVPGRVEAVELARAQFLVR